MRSRRFYGWLAWGLFASCVAMTGLALLLMFLNGPHRIVERLLYPLVFLAFAAVGALVASRRPENPVGWIFCILAITNVIWALALEYTLYAYIFHRSPMPGREVAAWLVTGWISSLGWGLMMTFVPLLFPTGRLLSQRWRPVAYLAAFACALQVFGLAFVPGPVDSSLPHVQNPLGIRGADRVFFLLTHVGSLFVVLTVLVCVGSLVVRFRRALGEERQQIKWFASAVVLLTMLVLISLLNSIIQGGENEGPIWGIVFSVSIVGIPAAAGVAILRYRLYDIDVIINRTLVYGAITATLALVYFGSVLLLQTLLLALTGERSQLAVVASTLIIAALFSPLRRRLQAFIDRRFYRKKYDAGQILATFGTRLRDEVELDTLSEDMLAVVRETMQPEHVRLWLRPTGDDR